MRTIFALLLALVLVVAYHVSKQPQANQFAFQAQAQLTYTQAKKQSESDGKPMLVFVSADWCPPCKQMKKLILPQLMMRNSFKNYHYCLVDYDKKRKLAKKLVKDKGIPQFIVFTFKEGKWVSRYIAGFKTVMEIETFLERK